MKNLTILCLSAFMLITMAAVKPGPKPKKTKKATKTEKAAPIVLSDKAFDIKWDKVTHNFGKIHQGDQVSTIFVLTNVGKEPIIITNHQVGCGCTTPEYPKEPIMPGKSANIKVGFNSAGKMGQQNKDVTLNFASGDKAVINFTCEVVEKPKVDPVKEGGEVQLKKTN